MGVLFKLASRGFHAAAKKLDRGAGIQIKGMNHKRVLVSKRTMSEQQALNLGFSPSLISIPEPGQARFVSLRHKDGYHVHDHGDDWIMHKDEHSPDWRKPISTAKHLIGEGAPGMIDYMRWRDGALLKHMKPKQPGRRSTT